MRYKEVFNIEHCPDGVFFLFLNQLESFLNKFPNAKVIIEPAGKDIYAIPVGDFEKATGSKYYRLTCKQCSTVSHIYDLDWDYEHASCRECENQIYIRMKAQGLVD